MANCTVTLGYSISGGYTAPASKVVTLGYRAAAATPPTAEGLEFSSPTGRLHATWTTNPLHASSHLALHAQSILDRPDAISPSRRLHSRTENG